MIYKWFDLGKVEMIILIVISISLYEISVCVCVCICPKIISCANLYSYLKVLSTFSLLEVCQSDDLHIFPDVSYFGRRY